MMSSGMWDIGFDRDGHRRQILPEKVLGFVTGWVGVSGIVDIIAINLRVIS